MEAKVGKKFQEYLDLVYSEKSKIIDIKSLQERKMTACKKIGWDHQDDEVKKVLELRDEKTRDQIIEFLCKNNSMEYMNLITDADLFLQLQDLKITPLTENKDEDKVLKAYNLKTEMSKKSQELLDRMNAAYEHIFKGQHEVKEAKKKVMWKTLEERIKQRDEKKKNVPQNQ